MNVRKFVLVTIFIVALIFSSVSVQAQGENEEIDLDFKVIHNAIDMEAIKSHVQYFESLGSRVSGYDGFYAAAEYIQAIFNQYCSDVFVDYFNVTIPFDYGSTLKTLHPTEKAYRIYPLVPNQVALSTTKPDGITGSLIYAGKGRLSDFNNKKVEGNIVLLDFNSEYGWITAMKLGAKAVIFVGSEEETFYQSEKTYVMAPVKFPRFYIRSEEATELIDMLNKGEEVVVNVTSNQQWERKTVGNILGWIYGEVNKTIVISSWYDSYSFVPSLAPGADEALNMAILLELAKFFHNNRPMYNLLFVAHAGHWQQQKGGQDFIARYWLSEEGYNKLGKSIILYISLDLSTASNIVGVSIRNQQVTGEWVPEVTPTMYWVYDIVKAAQQQGIPCYPPGSIDKNKQLFSTRQTGSEMYTTPILQGYFSANEGGLVAAGIDGPGLGLQTFMGFNPYRFTTQDVSARMNWQNAKMEINFVSCAIYGLANLDHTGHNNFLEGFGKWGIPKRTTAWFTYHEIIGNVVAYNATGFYDRIPNALVFLYPVEHTLNHPNRWYRGIPKWMRTAVEYADEEGRFHFDSVVSDCTYILYAYKLNSDGDIIFGPDYGRHMYSTVTYPQFRPYKTPFMVTYTVFECASVVLLDFYDPKALQNWGTLGVQVVDPRSQSQPEFYSTLLIYDTLPSGGWALSPGSSVSVAFIKPSEPATIHLYSIFSRFYPLVNALNASEENPLGQGYTLKVGEQIILTAEDYARDYYFINTARYQDLARSLWLKDLSTLPMIDQHQRMHTLISEAKKFLEKRDYEKYYQRLYEALNIGVDVYPRLRDSVLDSVSAILFFGLITIPFAFLFELFFFESSGFKRLCVILAIVIILILGLLPVHPAFLLAENPLFVLLGFAILILVAPVFMIIFNESKNAITTLARRILGRHAIKVRRTGFNLIGFRQGIRNMKRRRLRTALTLSAMIVVTTGLSLFTSMSPLHNVAPAYVPGTAIYDGIFIIPDINYGSAVAGVGENFVEYLDITYGNVAEINTRAWLQFSTNPREGDYYLVRANNRTVSVTALLGLTPQEVKFTKIDVAVENGTWLLPGQRKACLLPRNYAQDLGVKIGDKVSLLGLNFTIIGIYNPEIFDEIVDLNQERFTPLKIIQNEIIHMSSSEVMILPYKTLISMGGLTVSAALRFDSPVQVKEAAEHLFNFLRYPLWSSINGTVHVWTRAVALKSVGWQTMMIPQVLVILVLLNVFLGSIYERTREIAIYSTIGLSPAHIAVLFFSETVIYSILGGTFGYYIAMLIAKFVATAYPELGVVLNYTSSGVLMGVGIAMLSIILSTAYPLYRVARSVTPSLERVWRLPTKPVGDEWTVPLPFAMRDAEEAIGFFNYLKEYAEAHMAERAPEFSVKAIGETAHIKTEEGERLEFRLQGTSIPPYDAGIRQDVLFIANMPKGEKRIHLLLHLKRLGGDYGIWQTSNRRFVDVIRKQFLLWRSLSEEERKKYQL